MSTQTERLVATLNADSTGFQKALKQVANEAKATETAIDNVGKSAQQEMAAGLDQAAAAASKLSQSEKQAAADAASLAEQQSKATASAQAFAEMEARVTAALSQAKRAEDSAAQSAAALAEASTRAAAAQEQAAKAAADFAASEARLATVEQQVKAAHEANEALTTRLAAAEEKLAGARNKSGESAELNAIKVRQTSMMMMEAAGRVNTAVGQEGPQAWGNYSAGVGAAMFALESFVPALGPVGAGLIALGATLEIGASLWKAFRKETADTQTAIDGFLSGVSSAVTRANNETVEGQRAAIRAQIEDIKRAAAAELALSEQKKEGITDETFMRQTISRRLNARDQEFSTITRTRVEINGIRSASEDLDRRIASIYGNEERINEALQVRAGAGTYETQVAALESQLQDLEAQAVKSTGAVERAVTPQQQRPRSAPTEDAGAGVESAMARVHEAQQEAAERAKATEAERMAQLVADKQVEADLAQKQLDLNEQLKASQESATAKSIELLAQEKAARQELATYMGQYVGGFVTSMARVTIAQDKGDKERRKAYRTAVADQIQALGDYAATKSIVSAAEGNFAMAATLATAAATAYATASIMRPSQAPSAAAAGAAPVAPQQQTQLTTINNTLVLNDAFSDSEQVARRFATVYKSTTDRGLLPQGA